MQLSLLMPTHERPETLRLAIASVQAQSLADWELLVCGDGCGAATETVMAEATARDARVRWFPLPKAPGFGYANRNRVLDEARGELIGFAAHDNLVFRDHWRRLVGVFDDSGIHLAASSAAWVDEAGRLVPTIFNLSDASVRARFVSQKDNRLPANAFVYRRQLHDSVGRWDEALSTRGDLDLWSRILRHVGDSGFRYVPVVSFLHFRALWKTPDIADPHAGGVWPRLFDEAGRLPAILHTPVLAGRLPQEVFFELLHRAEGADHTDGADWEERVREACALAMEAYAGEAGTAWEKAMRDLARAKEKAKPPPPVPRPWWRR